MLAKSLRALPAAAAAVLLGACASDVGNGGLFSTASVAPATPEVASMSKPKVDPQCVTLASQIETLRKEGTIDRLEKAAAGKSDKVQVKRTAIAKQAELNKANVEFQVKCAPRIPTTNEAAAPAAAPQTVAAAPAAAAAKSVATKAVAKAAPAAPTGVTVVPAAPKVQ